MISQNQDTAADKFQQEPLPLDFVDVGTSAPHDLPPDPSPTAPEEPLPAHRYTKWFGKRTPKQKRRLSETMRISGGSVEVFLFDGQILWDPDLYTTARELGLPIEYIEYSGDDPIAFTCVRVLHTLHHDKGTRAVIMANIYPWVERGRPRKSTNNGDFLAADRDAKTTRQLADLAGVSKSYIEKAKEICNFGLADRAIDGKITFDTAYRRMADVRAAELAQAVLSGAMDFDTAWLQAQETLSAASDTGRQREPTKRDLAKRVNELESEVEELRRQLLDGNPDSRSGSLQSGDQVPGQLQKQRDAAIVRAEAAEAKIAAVHNEREELLTSVQRLRRIFLESGLDAPDVEIPTPAVDDEPQDNDRLVPSLRPATSA